MSKICGSYLPLNLSGTISSESGYIYSLPVISDQYVDANTYTRAEGTSRPYVLKSVVDIKDLTYSAEEFVGVFNVCTTTDQKRSLRNHFYRYILPRLRSDGTLQQLSKLLPCKDDQIRSCVIETMRNLIFGLDFEKLKIKYVLKALREIASFLVCQQDEGKEDGIRLLTDLTMILLFKERVLPGEPKEIQWGLREVHHIISKASKKDKRLVLNNLNEFLGKCLKNKMSKQGLKLIEGWGESSVTEMEVQNFIQNVQSVSPAEIYLLLLGLVFKLKIATMPSSIVECFTKITHAKLTCAIPSRDKKYESSMVFLADFIVRGIVFLFERKLLSCHSINVKEGLLEAMKIVCSPKSLFSALPCEVMKLVLKLDPKDACSIWSNLCMSDDQYQRMVSYHAQSQIPGLVLRHGYDFAGKRSDHSTWLCMSGTFMNRYEVQIKVLVPGRYKSKLKVRPEEDIEFSNTETEFEILKSIQGSQQHINVAQMLAFFDTIPRSFAMFAVELCGTNLLKHLYDVRSSNEEMTMDWKTKRCLEMLSAIDFLHHHNIVHRDIMARSFSLRCQGPDQGSAVLTSVRRSICNEVVLNTSIMGHVRDLNATQIPTRWSAPESFLQDKFDRKSDIWMLGHAIREVFTCGCQPYTEIYSEDTGNIMVKVIFCGLKPYKWSCIPMDIHSLTLKCFEMDPEKRPTVLAIYQSLKGIQRKKSGNPRRSTMSVSSIYGLCNSLYPKLSDGQTEFGPERGIPSLVKDLRKQKAESDPRATYICLKYQGITPRSNYKISAIELSAPDTPKIKRKRNTLLIKEPVSKFFYENILPKMSDDFAAKMQITTWPLDPQLSDEDNEYPFDIEYESPLGKSIMTLARQDFSQREHLIHMIEVAKLMEKMHDKYWILVDVCCQNFYLSSSSKEVFMPRIGRMLRLELPFDPDDDIVICHKLHKNRIHWHPVEVIRNSEYSMHSDVYMLAMVFYEYYTAVGLRNSGCIETDIAITASVPFATVEYNQMMDKLLSGDVPMKPSECPVWLYENIMVPCWSQERTSRPSIKQIVSLMNERLVEGENGSGGARFMQNGRLPDVISSPHLKPRSPFLNGNMQRKISNSKEHTYVEITDESKNNSSNDEEDNKYLSDAKCGNRNVIDLGASPKPLRKMNASKGNPSFEKAFRNSSLIRRQAAAGLSLPLKSNSPIRKSASNEDETVRRKQINEQMPTEDISQCDFTVASCANLVNNSGDDGLFVYQNEESDSDIEFANDSDND